MALPLIHISTLSVSRFIIGGNPFSGFSHQGSDKDVEMLHYYTVSRIKATLKEAVELGINTFIGRADQHIIRLLMEFRDEVCPIQWIAQTCPEIRTITRSIEDAIAGGAHACFIHGGVMDFMFANHQLEEIHTAIDRIKTMGLPAGIAGHNPHVFEWAEENLNVDFYLCSYYNSAHRDEDAEHLPDRPEWFRPEDRDIMVSLIQRLSKPVIHYKILAAGRNDPREAFEFTARYLRPQDAVCVGVYLKDNPNMLKEDVNLFESIL